MLFDFIFEKSGPEERKKNNVDFILREVIVQPLVHT